jgi:hypothetical protein
LGLINKAQGICWHYQPNNHEVNPIKIHPKNTREINRNWVVPHHIKQSKAKKTNVISLVASYELRTIVIHLKPQAPTLTPTNHVPIANAYSHDIDHCFCSYGKAIHKTPMLVIIRATIMGRVKKQEV